MSVLIWEICCAYFTFLEKFQNFLDYANAIVDLTQNPKLALVWAKHGNNFFQFVNNGLSSAPVVISSD